MNSEYCEYYDKNRNKTYHHEISKSKKPVEAHRLYSQLIDFIKNNKLEKKKCLEIGSGCGMFQDLVLDYTGTDISDGLKSYYKKPYAVATGNKYPFDNNSFDAIWTITVFEHIPHLDNALSEIKRLLKPGGVVFFAPAWFCRSWAADGYAVRAYSDFNLRGKIIKALIPIRNSIFFRALHVFPTRVLRHIGYFFGRRNQSIKYKKLKPNWDYRWVADSDACNSIDPYDAIIWFEQNGFKCISHPLHFKALFVPSSPLILKKV